MRYSQNRRGRNTHSGRDRKPSQNRGGSRNFSRGRGRGRGQKSKQFNPAQFINKNPVEEKQEVYKPKHTFASFGLNKKIVDTLTKSGITIPTPIQDQTIPVILDGRDVIGLAETGTGKTAAFLLPLIEDVLSGAFSQTLILAPTRELAMQIDRELKDLSRGTQIYSTICVGGTHIGPQIKGLKRKNHFIIGTPGRILDLMKRKCLRAEKITSVVLDEADRMLDMGFIHDIRSILSFIPDNIQTLFFSATMSREIEGLVNDFLNDPIKISVKKKDASNSIEQDVVYHGHHNKFETLTDLLEDKSFKRVIIFGSMKHSVQKLSDQLSRNGVPSEAIHGNKNHGQRVRALERFKKGNVRVLVATDVAARGIHVNDVSHVINYDLPNTFEDYIHRIGRTGRGSKKGKALTFIQK